MDAIPEHRYRGARALIALHEVNLRGFLVTWRAAKAAGVALPQTDDPDYASLELLLKHVLGCARHYILWCCESLDQALPQIDPAPEAEHVEEQMEAYTAHVLEGWRQPLRDVTEERFGESYASRWGSMYCIDGMLEHAVMHPIRHTFQLEALLNSIQPS